MLLLAWHWLSGLVIGVPAQVYLSFELLGRARTRLDVAFCLHRQEDWFMTEETAFSGANCIAMFDKRLDFASQCFQKTMSGELKDVQEVFDAIADGPTSADGSCSKLRHKVAALLHQVKLEVGCNIRTLKRYLAGVVAICTDHGVEAAIAEAPELDVKAFLQHEAEALGMTVMEALALTDSGSTGFPRDQRESLQPDDESFGMVPVPAPAAAPVPVPAPSVDISLLQQGQAQAKAAGHEKCPAAAAASDAAPQDQVNSIPVFRRLFPNAIYIAGIKHSTDNAMTAMNDLWGVMSQKDKWLGQLHAVEAILRPKKMRDKLIHVFFNEAHDHGQDAGLIETTRRNLRSWKASLKSLRWHECINFVAELDQVRNGLIKKWDLLRFVQALPKEMVDMPGEGHGFQGQKTVKSASTAILSDFFWAYTDLMVEVASAMDSFKMVGRVLFTRVEMHEQNMFDDQADIEHALVEHGKQQQRKSVPKISPAKSLLYEHLQRVEDSDHEHPTDSDPTATGACASDDVFFRVAHTSVGSHKMVLKGSVATTDIGVQILKVTHITPEEVSLSIDAQGMPQAVLAKWITDPQVTYQSLADNLKQWTMVKNKLFAIDMQKLRTMLPDLPQAGGSLDELQAEDDGSFSNPPGPAARDSNAAEAEQRQKPRKRKPLRDGVGLESDDFFLGEAGAEAEAVADYIDEDVIEISDGEEEDDEGSGLDDGTGVGNVIWEEANAEPPVAPGPGLKPAECGANVVNSAAFRSDLESGAAEPAQKGTSATSYGSFQHGPFHIAYRDDSHGQSYQVLLCNVATTMMVMKPRGTGAARSRKPDLEKNLAEFPALPEHIVPSKLRPSVRVPKESVGFLRGTSGKMSEVRPGAAPSDSTGRPREAQGSASSSFSEGLTSWGIEDTELAETTRFPSSAGAALPTTDEDARSLKEALQEALHAENTLLEREVERQRAEIQELKSRPRAAATPMMEPRAVEEPRAIEEPTVVRRVVPPAGVLTAPIQATPASATLSAPTPPRSATNSGCVSPRFTPVSMVSRTPGMPQAITEALLSPRFTTHRAVPAATPTSTAMAGWATRQDLEGLPKTGGVFFSQRTQYPLIKEYTLNHTIKDEGPYDLRYIP
ncbi:T6ODM [Symbiodinium microadriaticum]|nr:T6ODM [Symbiodinium microadriaticum]